MSVLTVETPQKYVFLGFLGAIRCLNIEGIGLKNDFLECRAKFTGKITLHYYEETNSTGNPPCLPHIPDFLWDCYLLILNS